MTRLAEFTFEQNVEEQIWREQARCNTGDASMNPLFYSDSLDDIARAKAFCGDCVVRAECLDAAIANKEPAGVWGGELIVQGKIVGQKRPRGRPKNAQTYS